MIAELPSETGRRWTNWAGNQTALPERTFTPHALADLPAIVALAREQHAHIRVVGGGYSWSPLVPTTGYLVDTSHLRQITVDRERKQVQAECGASIAEVNAAISAQGLGFASMTVIDAISVGGAVAHGTHGTGWNCRTISDAVVAMEIVLPDGAARTFSEATDGPAVMNAVRVNLGTLGIISRVTFQLVDSFNLHAIDEKRPMLATIAGIRELVTSNDYIELFWFPFNSKVWIKRWNRTDVQAGRARLAGVVRQAEAVNVAIGAKILDMAAAFPAATPFIDRLLFRFIGSKERVAPAPAVFHYQPAVMKVIDMGCALPVEPDFSNVQAAWNLAVRAVQDGAAAGKYQHNLILHARFLQGSDAVLSTAGGFERTCCIELVTYAKTPGYEEHFQQVYRAWMAMGGRPHWGKLLWDPAAIRAAYGERLQQFDTLRRQLDPDGMFLNPFLAELFATTE